MPGGLTFEHAIGFGQSGGDVTTVSMNPEATCKLDVERVGLSLEQPIYLSLEISFHLSRLRVPQARREVAVIVDNASK